MTRDLSLNRVVSKRDQLLIKDLIVYLVHIVVQCQRVFVQKTDKETQDRDAESKHVFELQHVFVLLATDLCEKELVVVLVSDTK